MTAPAAGWYPDPAGSGGSRRWDGASWSEHAAPPAAAWTSTAVTTPPRGFLARNRFSLFVLGFAALYLVLATTVHVAVLGILPILLGVRAAKGKEPLALAACVVAAGTLVLGLTGFAGLWRF